jgi:hypothetical protein
MYVTLMHWFCHGSVLGAECCQQIKYCEMPSMEEIKKLQIVQALKHLTEKKQKWCQAKHIINVAIKDSPL